MEQQKNFLEKLKNAQKEVILNGLEEYRNSTDIESLPIILQILESTLDEDVIEAILDLVRDLKDDYAASLALEFTHKTTEKKAQDLMIGALWQSDRDFSKMADKIIDMLINRHEFEILFDILTLLENNAQNIESKMAGELSHRLHEYQKVCDKEFLPIITKAGDHLKKFVNLFEE